MRKAVLLVVLVLALFARLASAQTGIEISKIYSRANLTVSPIGDIVFAPGGGDVYPSPNYGVNLGLLNAKFLTLHAAELWVETLVAQSTMATIGGRILVLPTTTLTADLGDGAGDTTITVKHNNLANGDTVYLEEDSKVEWLRVISAASGTGPYTYTVQRDRDGSGRNVWYAGTAVANTGTTGNGFIDLYSVRGVRTASEAGPTIVGNVRTGTTYSQTAPRWAIGNLNGLYGYGTTTYGAAFGDSAGTWLGIDATNGVRGMSGATERFHLAADGSGHVGNGNIYWDTSGNLFASGWSINAAAIAKDTGTNATSSGMAHADYPFYAGATYANRATAPFRVTPAGALVASAATVTGGPVTIGPSGISITAGVFDNDHAYKFSDNTGLFNGGSGQINLSGNYISLSADSKNLVWDNGSLYAGGTTGWSLGTSGQRWNDLYIDPPSTTYGDYPVVWSSGNHRLYYKTDGLTNADWNCGGTVHLNIEAGIIVDASCAAPSPSPELQTLQTDLATAMQTARDASALVKETKALAEQALSRALELQAENAELRAALEMRGPAAPVLRGVPRRPVAVDPER